MLSDTPIELLRKHVKGEFERDVHSMNILWEMIMKQYTELYLVFCICIDAGYEEEAKEIDVELKELGNALSMPWKI